MGQSVWALHELRRLRNLRIGGERCIVEHVKFKAGIMSNSMELGLSVTKR